jgi:hypothetical protein
LAETATARGIKRTVFAGGGDLLLDTPAGLGAHRANGASVAEFARVLNTAHHDRSWVGLFAAAAASRAWMLSMGISDRVVRPVGEPVVRLFRRADVSVGARDPRLK